MSNSAISLPPYSHSKSFTITFLLACLCETAIGSLVFAVYLVSHMFSFLRISLVCGESNAQAMQLSSWVPVAQRDGNIISYVTATNLNWPLATHEVSGKYPAMHLDKS